MVKRFFRRMRRSEAGQSATEYMLVIAVIVLGLLAAASKLVPMFRGGVETLGNTITTKYLNNEPPVCKPGDPNC